MNALLQTALQTYQRPDASNFTQIGELSEVLKDFKGMRPTKAAYVKQLVHADGRTVALVFSKPLSAALAAGEVTGDQLGYCMVARTTDAQGQNERFRLTLPADFRGEESTEALLAVFAKAARPKAKFDAASLVNAF